MAVSSRWFESWPCRFRKSSEFLSGSFEVVAIWQCVCVCVLICLQCFDAVGWAAERAFGL